MILRQLQHHRSRVPAIPPCTGPITRTFTFDRFDIADLMSERSLNSQWKDFLTFLGFRTTLSYREFMTPSRESLHRQEFMCEQGMRFQIDEKQGGNILIFTATRPARLSPKLLSTFPWKLRKFQTRP